MTSRSANLFFSTVCPSNGCISETDLDCFAVHGKTVFDKLTYLVDIIDKSIKIYPIQFCSTNLIFMQLT